MILDFILKTLSENIHSSLKIIMTVVIEKF